MENQLILQENSLQLAVTEKTLGALTTNALQIKEYVEEILPRYDIANYNEDNIDQAKKDKAVLNKASKALNDKRIEIEKEFVKPLAEFKDVVTATCKMIGDCSSKIDSVVKQSEQQYKDKKKVEAQAHFDDNNTNLIVFDKIFNQSWLNKSTTIKSVKSEIDNILKRVDGEIKSLETFSEDKDVLVTYYKDSLNIGNTIQYANRLKEQRERVAEAEKARAEAEEAKRAAEDVIKNQPAQSIPFVEPESPKQETSIPAAQPELLTRAFKVTTTKENIIALGEFMNANSINFDKNIHTIYQGQQSR